MKSLNFKKVAIVGTVSALATQPAKPIKKKQTPESSQVVSLEYDPNKLQLTVEFKNGTYDYTPVPESVADEAWAADSIGKFINTIKNKYNCKKR